MSTPSLDTHVGITDFAAKAILRMAGEQITVAEGDIFKGPNSHSFVRIDLLQKVLNAIIRIESPYKNSFEKHYLKALLESKDSVTIEMFKKLIELQEKCVYFSLSLAIQDSKIVRFTNYDDIYSHQRMHIREFVERIHPELSVMRVSFGKTDDVHTEMFYVIHDLVQKVINHLENGKVVTIAMSDQDPLALPENADHLIAEALEEAGYVVERTELRGYISRPFNFEFLIPHPKKISN